MGLDGGSESLSSDTSELRVGARCFTPSTKQRRVSMAFNLSRRASNFGITCVDNSLLHGTSAEMVTRQSHGRRVIVLLLCCYCRATLLLLSC